MPRAFIHLFLDFKYCEGNFLLQLLWVERQWEDWFFWLAHWFSPLLKILELSEDASNCFLIPIWLHHSSCVLKQKQWEKQLYVLSLIFIKSYSNPMILSAVRNIYCSSSQVSKSFFFSSPIGHCCVDPESLSLSLTFSLTQISPLLKDKVSPLPLSLDILNNLKKAEYIFFLVLKLAGTSSKI